MPAYFLAEVEVQKPDTYAEYVAKVSGIIEKFGGRYVFRSESIHPVSGDWRPRRMIMIAFDSKQRILECFSSDEYAAVAPLREESTQSRAVVIDC